MWVFSLSRHRAESATWIMKYGFGPRSLKTKIIFPVQLTTSRIGNLTRLIHTLAICVTIHTITLLWSSMNISLSPLVPAILVSRDGFSSPVPRQTAHLYTQAESGAYLRDSSRVPRRRPFIYLNRHTPSGQSRVYRVAQLRTDGVHCRESAGTGPVNLKVVPNGCCLSRSPWTN